MAPLRLVRIFVLFMAFAWGLIAFALAISALVKSNNQKNLIRHSIPPGASVSISTSDIIGAGGALTAACGLLFLLSLLFLLPLLPLPFLALPFLTLPLQAHLLAFTTVFIFACAVPTSYFVAQHQAKISASIGGNVLPPAVVQSVESALGVTGIYKHIGYLRLIAIIPWIAFLFALLATIVSYMAISREATTFRGGSAAATAGPANVDGKKDGTIANEQPVDEKRSGGNV